LKLLGSGYLKKYAIIGQKPIIKARIDEVWGNQAKGGSSSGERKSWPFLRK
jgi:hypothetical protein